MELSDGQRVGYVLVGDQVEALAVFDHEDGVLALGDVMLPYEAVFDTREEAEEARQDRPTDGFRTHGLVYFSDVADPTWSRVASGPEAGSLRIPYVISDPRTPAQRERVLSAMSYWRRVAPVVLSPRTNQADYIAIEIDDDLGCAAYIGNVGGRRRLTVPSVNNPNAPIFGRLDDNCILHELGHTIGFFHKQSRLDRDDFVRLRPANIEIGQERNFNFRGNGIGLGPYDLASIMQYGSRSWTTNGRPTIVRKNGGLIGVPERLSSGDAEGATTSSSVGAATTSSSAAPATTGCEASGTMTRCSAARATIAWRTPMATTSATAETTMMSSESAGRRTARTDTTFYGRSGTDLLLGGADDDDLRGGEGSDDLRGSSGRDVLYGGTDSDTVYGGHGHDLFFLATDDDLFGGPGHDKLVSGVPASCSSVNSGSNGASRCP